MMIPVAGTIIFWRRTSGGAQRNERVMYDVERLAVILGHGTVCQSIPLLSVHDSYIIALTRFALSQLDGGTDCCRADSSATDDRDSKLQGYGKH